MYLVSAQIDVSPWMSLLDGQRRVNQKVNAYTGDALITSLSFTCETSPHIWNIPGCLSSGARWNQDTKTHHSVLARALKLPSNSGYYLKKACDVSWAVEPMSVQFRHGRLIKNVTNSRLCPGSVNIPTMRWSGAPMTAPPCFARLSVRCVDVARQFLQDNTSIEPLPACLC